ncbi:tail length tape measure protein [Synechococcus virus S-ESS1]|uniref:Tail length tape measure protein n=1 Tax=Synechococcus virus S-ESS1 TaxID=1964565 RepID=A0A1V0DX72_9CAUD|nr:tail length tape measure protein [Synechococcus virus S-ESS1]ARB05717.1 tail length tape measure protein [Synechococcus virus S-ESS1]
MAVFLTELQKQSALAPISRLQPRSVASGETTTGSTATVGTKRPRCLLPEPTSRGKSGHRRSWTRIVLALRRRAAEEREKERASTAERIENGNFEIEQQKLINAGLERKAAVEEAIRAAKQDDPNITAEELALIKQQTEAIYDLEEAKKNATTASERAKEAEQEVNNLLATRAALQDQVNLAVEQGRPEQAENLRLKIGEINAELLAAITNAQNMWKAVGGSEAEAAIQKLEAAKIETQNFNFEAGKTYLQWNRVADLFVTGLASAFDTFAQKVAEGESAGEAARQAFLKFASDFLIQIAQ